MGERSPVAIVVDSAASLPEDMPRLPQMYVAPMRVTLGDRTYTDGRELRPTDFYRILRESSVLPSTSAPSPEGFLEAFRGAAGEARSVLCLTVGSQFSVSFDSANAAARLAQEAIPQVEVSVLDTGSAAGGEGLIALEATRAARQGKGLHEVKSAVQNVMTRVRLLAFVDTLYYLWKGGRVPGIAHVGTSLLRIKPLFELAQGQVRSVARPRTHRRAMRRLLELVRDGAKPSPMHVTVMHADAAGAAEELRQQIEAEFPCEELFISEFSPVMGAHTGPGLVGVAFWNE